MSLVERLQLASTIRYFSCWLKGSYQFLKLLPGIPIRQILFLGLLLCCPCCNGRRDSLDQGPATVIESGQELDSVSDTTAARGDQSSTTNQQLELRTPAFEIWQELDHIYRNGEEQDIYSIVESLGGGVGLLDYDLDGRMDLCLPGGGSFSTNDQLTSAATTLLRNTAQGNELSFVDRSQASFIADSQYYTHGIAIADYDNDGFPDVLITGYGGLMLWHNQGDGTFIEISQSAGLNSQDWSSSAAWGDLNNDGLVDLYVVNYVDWSFENHPRCKAANGLPDVCPPKDFIGQADKVYFNAGDGTFRDVGQKLGLKKDGKGLGVVLADFDQDGWLDIYVANDTTANFLYLNQLGERLEECAELRGVAYDDRGIPNGSMGVDVFDYNQNGLLDIWVTNYENETFALYRNVGDCFFVHSSRTTGLTSFGQSYVGFGTVCGDFDLDGYEDIVVTNGHVIRHPQHSPRRQNPLFLTNSAGRFKKEIFPEENYFSQFHEGRGLATGDMNDDGAIDIVITHLNEKSCVLKNLAQSDRWLQLRLIGVESNRDAIGAVVWLVTDQRKMLRTVRGGGSYLSCSEKTLHWAWNESETPIALEILWPSGLKQEINLAASAVRLTVIEPAAIP